MIFRYAEQNDYEAVRALWLDGFGDEVPSYNDWYFDTVYKPDRTICCIDNDQMTACLQTAPYSLQLNGSEMLVAYLVGVVTGSQFRHKGYGHALLRYTFDELRKNGIKMAMLFTDIPSFYQPVGFVHCYEHKKITIKPECVSPTRGWQKHDELIPFIEKAAPIYEKMTAEMNGFIQRSRENWLTFLGDYYNAGGGMWHSEDAYFVWTPEDGHVLIRELGFTSKEAMEDALCRIAQMLVEIDEKEAIWNAPLSAPIESDEKVPFAMCRRVDIPSDADPAQAAAETLKLYENNEFTNWVNEMT